MKILPSPSRAVGFVTNHAYGLTLTALFAVGVHGFGSYGLRQYVASPQSSDIKAGVLVLFRKPDGQQLILNNNPLLSFGDGFHDDATVHDGYKSIDELQAATNQLIDAHGGADFYDVQVREQDIIDGGMVSPLFAATPQVCEDHDHCRPVATARLGNSFTVSNAKSELSRTFDQYRDLQAEYDQPKIKFLGLGYVLRKAEKEIYSIPFVKSTSDFVHSIRIG